MAASGSITPIFDPQDISGQQFGRLTALYRSPIRSKTGAPQWLCRCVCGSEKLVARGDLRSGNVKSCGCLKRDLSPRPPAHRGTPGSRKSNYPLEYNSWSEARQRCHNPNNKDAADYAERGITMCDRWRFGEDGKTGFACFIEDMGPRPYPRMSIDRIDNSRGYEPANCKWSTAKEQNNNRRPRRWRFAPISAT